jgi:hypothetical protein
MKIQILEIFFGGGGGGVWWLTLNIKLLQCFELKEAHSVATQEVLNLQQKSYENQNLHKFLF